MSKDALRPLIGTFDDEFFYYFGSSCHDQDVIPVISRTVGHRHGRISSYDHNIDDAVGGLWDPVPYYF